MAIIGTSTQPGFYEEKAAKAGQLIQLLLANQQQRQARQDAQEKEQLNFFFQAVEKDPSIANAMGPDLVKRYGDKYPVLPAIVKSMQDKQKILGDMDTATQGFTSKLDSMQSDFKQMQDHASTLPDTLPFNVHVPTLQGSASTGSGISWLNQQSRDANASMAGSPVVNPPLTLQMPNPEKARIQATLSQMNPGMFPTSAAMALPANQQILLRMNPAVAHLLPKEMPSLQDIPEAQRPLVMGQMGLVSPEIVAAAKMQLGITPKPAVLQEQGAKQAAEEYKQTQENSRAGDQRTWEQRKIDQEFQNRKTIESITDTHTKQRIAQNISGEQGVVKLKHGLDQNDDGTVPWKALADSSNTEVKDWQDGYKSFLTQQKDSRKSDADLQAATTDWMAKNPRPVRVPESVTRIITMKINRVVKANPVAADSAGVTAMKKAQEYQQLMQQPGMTSDKAIQQLFP